MSLTTNGGTCYGDGALIGNAGDCFGACTVNPSDAMKDCLEGTVAIREISSWDGQCKFSCALNAYGGGTCKADIKGSNPAETICYKNTACSNWDPSDGIKNCPEGTIPAKKTSTNTENECNFFCAPAPLDEFGGDEFGGGECANEGEIHGTGENRICSSELFCKNVNPSDAIKNCPEGSFPIGEEVDGQVGQKCKFSCAPGECSSCKEEYLTKLTSFEVALGEYLSLRDTILGTMPTDESSTATEITTYQSEIAALRLMETELINQNAITKTELDALESQEKCSKCRQVMKSFQTNIFSDLDQLMSRANIDRIRMTNAIDKYKAHSSEEQTIIVNTSFTHYIIWLSAILIFGILIVYGFVAPQNFTFEILAFTCIVFYTFLIYIFPHIK